VGVSLGLRRKHPATLGRGAEKENFYFLFYFYYFLFEVRIPKVKLIVGTILLTLKEGPAVNRTTTGGAGRTPSHIVPFFSRL